jgi:hypothetical protein
MSDYAELRQKYVEPIWLNIEKTIIEVNEETNENRVFRTQTLVIKKWDDDEETLPNYLFQLITEIYSEEEIDQFTDNYNKERKDENERIKKEDEQNYELLRLEKLFKTKLDIFNINAIFNSDNKKAKSEIRRAKNDVEAIALAVMLLLEEKKKNSDENI